MIGVRLGMKNVSAMQIARTDSPGAVPYKVEETISTISPVERGGPAVPVGEGLAPPVPVPVPVPVPFPLESPRRNPIVPILYERRRTL